MKNNMRTSHTIFISIFFVTLLFPGALFAAVMTSSTYSIQSDSLNVAGTENSASLNYKVSDTAGEQATGNSTGVAYLVKAGYRALLDAIFSGNGNNGGNNNNSGNTGGTNGTGGNRIPAPFAIENVVISPSDIAVVLSYRTNQLAKTSLKWGETNAYEKPVLSQGDLATEHFFKIENLKPSTRYYFAIDAENVGGEKAPTIYHTLVTLAGPDTEPPANVSPLTAVVLPSGGDILVTWDNPKEPDFESVTIVRSESFYPQSVENGTVMYQGRDNSFIDSSLKPGTLYYYTVFSKDVSGNYSSGAIFSIKLGQEKEGVIIPTEISKQPVIDTSKFTGTPAPLIGQLELSDIRVSQDGHIIPFDIRGRISVDGTKLFKIEIPYEKLPEVLKTIAVSVEDPRDTSKVFSFLLRVNKQKTAYEAIIGEFGKEGNYDLSFVILDHTNQGLKELKGKLAVKMPAAVSLAVEPVSLFKVFSELIENNVLLAIVLIILLVLLGIWFLLRR
jgi:hypothetical protein